MIFTLITQKGVCSPSLSIHERNNSPPVLQSAGDKLKWKINQFYLLLLFAGPPSLIYGFKCVSFNVNSTYEMHPGS